MIAFIQNFTHAFFRSRWSLTTDLYVQLLLDDPAVVGAIDEETEFNALVVRH